MTEESTDEQNTDEQNTDEDEMTEEEKGESVIEEKETEDEEEVFVDNEEIRKNEFLAEENTQIERIDNTIIIDDDEGDVIGGGTVGNVTWVVYSSGKLVVNGSGDFKQPSGIGVSPHWVRFADEVTSAVVNLSEVTDASSMFAGFTALTSVDLSNFDTSTVTNMDYMFGGCTSLTSLDLTNFNTSKVTDMSYMFNDCTKLEKLDLSSFDTSNVTAMSCMFRNCLKLEELNLSNFNLCNVTDANYMLGAEYNTSYTKIYTPYNLTEEVFLPRNNKDIWYLSNGTSIFYLPTNTDKSVTITKNYILGTDDTDNEDNKPNNITWNIDENGKLTLNGTGDVDRDDDGNVPWYNDRAKITSAEVNVTGMTNASKLFFNCSNLESVDFTNFDTSQITDMSYMFSGSNAILSNNKLVSIDLSGFDTSQVTDMSYMFFGCCRLTSLDLSNFKTSNVTNMRGMFENCGNLESLNLSGFDTSNVTDMGEMFDDCFALTQIDLKEFDTSNVTRMDYMFGYCSGLNALDLSSFNTSKVTDMSSMFYFCKLLTELDLGGFDTGNVTNMNRMVYGCINLTSVNLSSFNTINVTDMSHMFDRCESLAELNLSNFDVSNLNTAQAILGIDENTNLTKIYSPYNLTIEVKLPYDYNVTWYLEDGTKVVNLPMNTDKSELITKKIETVVNTSNDITWSIDENGKITITGTGDVIRDDNGNAPWYVYSEKIKSAEVNVIGMTNASGLFRGCINLESVIFTEFDTSLITDMSYMFSSCCNLTELDVSKFDTSKVTNMSHMFDGCNKLQKLDVSKFDTSKVTDMSYMFYGCRELIELDVKNFVTSNVTNMEGLFAELWVLNELDVSNFDTSNVTDMKDMFAASFSGSSSLVKLDLSNFDTSNVTNMCSMFDTCYYLEELNLSNFDTSNVTNMYEMFRACSNLKKLVWGEKFVTNNVTSMGLMFASCTSLPEQDLNNFIKQFITDEVTNMSMMFANCTSLTELDLSSFNTSKVTDMMDMFEGCSNLAELNLSNFDTSNVTDMISMFEGCSSLTELNLSAFDTHNVKGIRWMFKECSSLTELDLSNFDFGNVQNNQYYSTEGVFDGCSNLSKIYTPYNLSHQVTLPTSNENDIWYKTYGTIITELPQNLTKSILIEKNKVPSLDEKPSHSSTTEENTEGFKADFAVDVSNLIYTGNTITPKVTATFNGKFLTEGVDYTVKYANNINVSTKPATATVTVKDICSGGAVFEYYIKKKDINEVQTSQSIVVISGQKPKLAVSFNGKTLGTKDYTVKYLDGDGKEIKDGKYNQNGTIELSGKGNFTGTRTIMVKVAKKEELKKLSVSLNVKSKTYTGDAITLLPNEYIVTAAKAADTESPKETEDNGATGDYIVTYASNTKVGTAKVTFTGIGYYTGSNVTKTFKITPATSGITQDTTKLKSSYTFNQSGVTIGSDIVLEYNGVQLIENTDYKVKYTDNKKAGQAGYKVTFIGNFKGHAPITDGKFNIDTPKLSDSAAVVAVSADKIYKKKGVYTSTPVVTYNGATVKSSNYTVEYYSDKERKNIITKSTPLVIGENDSCATVYVKITAKEKSEYQGICETCEFTVWKSKNDIVDISKAKITISASTKGKVAYTGDYIDSLPIDVKIKNKTITSDKLGQYFEVIYYNNINLGKATVMIKAKEKSGYIGSATGTFTITKKDITKK